MRAQRFETQNGRVDGHHAARVASEISPGPAQALADPRATLDALRAQIEQLDRQLVEIVAQRQELARAVAAAKQAAGVPIVDLAREAAVVRAAAAHARAVGLDEEAMRHLFWCLIDLSRRAQLGAPS